MLRYIEEDTGKKYQPEADDTPLPEFKDEETPAETPKPKAASPKKEAPKTEAPKMQSQ